MIVDARPFLVSSNIFSCEAIMTYIYVTVTYLNGITTYIFGVMTFLVHFSVERESNSLVT